MDFVTLTVLLMVVVTSESSHNSTQTSETTIGRATAKPFINFTEGFDRELFSLNGSEYIFINKAVTQNFASHICRDMHAQLAVLFNVEIVEYVVEALAESRFEFDTLWVAGKLQGINGTTASVWTWEFGENNKQYENITDDVLKFFVNEKTLGVEDVDKLRRCLGFGRNNHLQPEFRPLSCNAKRHIICRQPRGTLIGQSSHKGWIRIGKRVYKIFVNKGSHFAAEAQCSMLSGNDEIKLAVVASVHEAHVLARYMLIGRPSLEVAWIGAKRYGKTYAFEAENLRIPSKTAANGYPPWQGGHSKAGRCVQLDRHLQNITFFVTLGCKVPRGRICYRKLFTDEPQFVDVIFENWGYRLVTYLMTWQASVNYCDQFSKFNGRLAEITEAKQRVQMLYVMGENKTDLHHVWLGGKYIDHKWMWSYSKTEVNKDLLVKWISNKTYVHSVDENYICLNMDREKHIESLFYGTECDYMQYFICLFPASDLIGLQKQEEETLMASVLGQQSTASTANSSA